MLRQICADVVELRRGDHSAQRLLLERERLAAQNLDAEHKWKRKIVVGIQALSKYVERHPEAKAAFEELVKQMHDAPNPAESDSIRSNQTNPP